MNHRGAADAVMLAMRQWNRRQWPQQRRLMLMMLACRLLDARDAGTEAVESPPVDAGGAADARDAGAADDAGLRAAESR